MKDAFYFPHDCNAIQDPKMMRLLMECGVGGIGLFWIIIEVLHQQNGGAIGLPEVRHYINFYGKQGSWDENALLAFEKIVFETKLLILDGEMVTSERVKQNLEKRSKSIEMGRIGAYKRWAPNGHPMVTQSHPNTRRGEKRREEEKKKGIVDPPEKDGGPTPDQLVKLWNAKAHPNLPRVAILTDSRKTNAKCRLTEHPDQGFWEDLVARVNRSPHLRGENGRSWKASFDWVIKPDSIAKILEGNYEPDKRR